MIPILKGKQKYTFLLASIIQYSTQFFLLSPNYFTILAQNNPIKFISLYIFGQKMARFLRVKRGKVTLYPLYNS